eukprot:GHVU01124339.1.p2 GENE.GHVU01124339.1~~GHVU01124339.1.p2  ORF type:complete len:109 (-),score=26.16 GHVU01124339.1:65-391(-)
MTALVTAAMNGLEKERQTIVGKITDLMQDMKEHRLVLEAFEGVPPERRCFRMIGGVLIERTVGEVKPALESHERMVKEVTDKLEAELEQKTKLHSFLAARAPQQQQQS